MKRLRPFVAGTDALIMTTHTVTTAQATWKSFNREHGRTAAIAVAGAILSLCWMQFENVASSTASTLQFALVLIAVAAAAVLAWRDSNRYY